MKELLIEVHDSIKKNNSSFKQLSSNESDELLGKLKLQYNLDFGRKYLWELNQPAKVEEYGEDWEIKFKNLLALFNEKIFLAVTDDEFYPWNVFQGSKYDLLNLLGDVRFFEFFIFDDSLNHLLFDTHHNVLMLFKRSN